MLSCSGKCLKTLHFPLYALSATSPWSPSNEHEWAETCAYWGCEHQSLQSWGPLHLNQLHPKQLGCFGQARRSQLEPQFTLRRCSIMSDCWRNCFFVHFPRIVVCTWALLPIVKVTSCPTCHCHSGTKGEASHSSRTAGTMHNVAGKGGSTSAKQPQLTLVEVPDGWLWPRNLFRSRHASHCKWIQRR